MAWIKYFIKGSQNPSTIYLRFAHGRKVDLKRSTSLLINPDYWSNAKGSVKSVAAFEDKINLQNKLNDLTKHILNAFNDSYANGVLIDGNWLNNSISEHFKQDKGTQLNFIVEYAEYFHKNLSTKIQANGRTGATLSTKKKYRTIINKLNAFEKLKNKRLKLTDINLRFRTEFVNYLHDIELLNFNTTGKYLIFVKTICLDAKKHGFKISPDLENGEFRPTKEKIDFVTLNEYEINKVFEKDLSDIPHLDNARNWLIIGVWSGARVSDLLNFTLGNIHNGFIEYTSQKTNQKIVLPLHYQVKQIIENLNGQLPRKISSQKFNEYIKKVCDKSGITEVVHGSKNEKIKDKVWRKKRGEHPKNELVTSHICRRSFATNHYGKLPTPVIMAVTGHTTEKMFLKYIGKTAMDNAEVLQEFWKLQERKKENKKHQLSILKTVND
jgi:integrase